MKAKVIVAACIASVVVSVWAFEAGPVTPNVDQPFQRVQSVRELSQTEVDGRFGGSYWDEYCVTDRFTCNASYGVACDNLYHTGSCFRCVSDSEVEKCDGDDWCIPYITCNDCIVDTPHECGKETAGYCSVPGPCIYDYTMNDDCGSAFKCHTD